jgi:hypothetical protein
MMLRKAMTAALPPLRRPGIYKNLNPEKSTFKNHFAKTRIV